MGKYSPTVIGRAQQLQAEGKSYRAICPILEQEFVGQTFDPDRLRKACKGSTLKAEPEGRKELHYKKQIAILAKKCRALEEEASLQEALLDIARDNIEALPTAPAPIPRKLDNERTEEVSVLDNSDFHIGEVVKGDEVGWINSYDFSTYAKRLEHMFGAIHSIKSKLTGYELKKLYINGLGDMVSGIIHQDLIENADDSVYEWVFNGALMYSQFLADLLTIYDEIEFTGVVGNHGRMQKDIRFKKRYVNWDYFFYQIVALIMMNNPRIKFDLPKSFWVVKEMGGRRQLLLHGDNIKSWMGIPWYGIQKAVYRLTELLAATSVFFDDVHLAHFHNLGSIQRVKGKMFINGSLIGGNDYAIGSLFLSSEPQQLFFGINPKKKRLSWRFDLDLVEADKIVKPRYKYSKTVVVADQVRELLR